MASTVLGFVGDDNQGLSGIEYQYDSTLEGIDVYKRQVLDECTEASVANWKAADSCAWQGDAVNIWWPLRARVKFAEVKNLTGIESVFIDWTGSAQEAEFGGDSPFETGFSREVADPDQYGMVLTSFDGRCV